ncbi:MAG TPA: hypothetical protein VF691_08130 [Cytophagaceae bacterium]
MKKKTEIPMPGGPNPKAGQVHNAQKPSTNTREDVKAKTTEYVNPNGGPTKRSK